MTILYKLENNCLIYPEMSFCSIVQIVQFLRIVQCCPNMSISLGLSGFAQIVQIVQFCTMSKVFDFVRIVYYYFIETLTKICRHGQARSAKTTRHY